MRKELAAKIQADADILEFNRQNQLEVELAMRSQLDAYTPRVVSALEFLPAGLSYKWDYYTYAFGNITKRGLVTKFAKDGTLNIYIEGVTSWSHITPVFEVLQHAGLDVNKWESRDDAASYTRIYNYDLTRDLHIKIHATLPGDTDECRRVLVGYKSQQERFHSTDPQPIYKLECK